jgi:hypothetical protein
LPGVPLLLLNATGKASAGTGLGGWGGDPDTGFIRYALDVAEAGQPNPALLRGLQEATSQKERLGEVVQFVNSKLGLKALIMLNQEQLNRRIGELKKMEKERP